MKRTPLTRKTPLRTTKPLRAKKPMARRPKRARTPEEKGHMTRVATLGCCVGNRLGNRHCRGRTTVHHLSGAGMGLKASDFQTIPLCEAHHLFGPHSIEQMGRADWEKAHGRQEDLLSVTRIMLALVYPDWCEQTGLPLPIDRGRHPLT